MGSSSPGAHPRKSDPVKIRAVFDQLIRSHLGAHLTAVLDFFWIAEQLPSDKDCTDAMATMAVALIDQLETLAAAAPPRGWMLQPRPAPLMWEQLDATTRDLLHTMRVVATAHHAGVRLFLTGSRAAGTARPDSDFDILMAFPTLDGPLVDQTIGNVSRCARGIDIDVVHFDRATWEQPDPSYELQVDLLRQCHIEIPGRP